MSDADGGRSGDSTYGTVILLDNKLQLEYTYWYEQRCNCHPETCECGGMDRIYKDHIVEIKNPENTHIGQMVQFNVCNNKAYVY